jgi:lipoprotein-anchoring transpeptidase ErfK/SrfK
MRSKTAAVAQASCLWGQRASRPLKTIHRFAILLILALSLVAFEQLSASSEAALVISVPDQTLALVEGDEVRARYRISASKFGTGDHVGSYRTPLGTLFVSGKFGDRLRAGTVIKNRASTGEVIAIDAPNRDAIVSRVIWLRGMESQNSAAHDRCIYIHGTAEERNLGRPVSFGCIRMRSRDVIALYDRVHVGMHVTISEKLIDELLPQEKPTLLSRAD